MKKADAKKSDGCYEMRNVSEGIYFISLKDDRFESLRTTSVVQAKVRLFYGDVKDVNLTTELPDSNLLQAGAARALRSANSGFSLERDANVPSGSTWGDWGSGLPANILSGFMKCTIHYHGDFAGATAAEWCALEDIKKEDSAVAFFEKIRNSVHSAVGDVPGFRYDELKEGEGECGNCVRHAEWISPTNGAISLRMFHSHSLYGIELWLVYSRRMAAESCTAIARGLAAQPDPKMFEADLAKVVSEIQAVVREQVRVGGRNLLRALLIGGTLETAPTPVAVTEFPAPDASITCVGPGRP